MQVIDFLQKFVFWLRLKQWDVTLATWEHAILWAVEEWISTVYALTQGEWRRIRTEYMYDDFKTNLVDFKTVYPIEKVVWIYPGPKQNVSLPDQDWDCITEDCDIGCNCCEVDILESLKTKRLALTQVSAWKELLQWEYKIAWWCFGGWKFWNYVVANVCNMVKCDPCTSWWYIEYYASYKPIECLEDEIPLPYQYLPWLSLFVWAALAPTLEWFAAWQDVNWITIARDMIEAIKSKKTPSFIK